LSFRPEWRNLTPCLLVGVRSLDKLGMTIQNRNMNKETAKKILDKVKRDYTQTARVRQKIWMEEKSLIKNIKNGDTVLDLGCGQGRIVPLLKNKKVNYLGLDNCSVLLKNAQDRHPDYKFIRQDLVNLDLPKKSFDVILLIATLHQIPSNKLRKKVLKDVYKLLKPGGLLLMTNWNSASYRNKIKAKDLEEGDYYIRWRTKKKFINRYYHQFTLTELSGLLKLAKFSIKKNQKLDTNIVTIAKS